MTLHGIFFRAETRKCPNLSNGEIREGRKTQLKHHWWWKANRVFDELVVTRNHNGLVLLMEEDYYMADDALHMLPLMQKEAAISCPECDVINLGGKHDSIYHYRYLKTNEVNIK